MYIQKSLLYNIHGIVIINVLANNVSNSYSFEDAFYFILN